LNGLFPSGHEVEAQNSESPYELAVDRASVPVKLTVSFPFHKAISIFGEKNGVFLKKNVTIKFL
jgi:hypothetical protein